MRVGTDVSGREDGNDGHKCMGHELMGWSLGWAGLQRTSVSEAVTETSSAMALAPSTPSSQPVMSMLSMLLPFIAAMSSSEAAWLMRL